MLRGLVAGAALAAAFFAPAALADSLKVTVNGAERTIYQERYALLIGASDYTKGWPDLSSVQIEQDRLGAALTAQGFKVERLSNPTKSNLAGTIQDFIARRGNKNNAILIFFSGHGWTDPLVDRGYIAPVDAPNPDRDLEGFKAMAVSMGLMRSLVRDSEAMHTLVMFDSCFSGSVFLNRSPSEAPKSLPWDIAHYDQVRTRAIQAMTSGGAGQKAPAQSRFIDPFIAAINGAADLDGDGIVSMKEVGFYFDRRVNTSPLVPQFGYIDDYETGGDFLFKPRAAAVPVATAPRVPTEDPKILLDRAIEYLEGHGVPQNYPEAARLFKLASDQGYATAQNNLATMYLDGRGVSQNDMEAARLFRLAADQGLSAAQSNLAKMYLEPRGGLPKNGAEAARLFRLAADQGFVQAQTSLGAMYQLGEGVPRNDAEALRLYKLSADQGDVLAETALASMYGEGVGVPRNDAEAARLYKLAADKGYGTAQYNLALMYSRGIGIPRNDAEAARYYRLAADQGNAEAQVNLGTFYELGRGVPRNEVEAARLYKLAADTGLASAQSNLAQMHAEGRGGLPKNEAEAVRLFTLAARQGSPNSQNALRDRGLKW